MDVGTSFVCAFQMPQALDEMAWKGEKINK